MTPTSRTRTAGVAALVACGLLALAVAVVATRRGPTAALPAIDAIFGIALIVVAWGVHPMLDGYSPRWALGALAACVTAGALRIVLDGLELVNGDTGVGPADIVLVLLNATWFGTIGAIAERGHLWPSYLSLYAQLAAVGFLLAAGGLWTGRFLLQGLPSPVLGVFGLAFLARFGILASRGSLGLPAGHS